MRRARVVERLAREPPGSGDDARMKLRSVSICLNYRRKSALSEGHRRRASSSVLTGASIFTTARLCLKVARKIIYGENTGNALIYTRS